MPGAGLWQYVTFRSGVAVMVSLVVSMLFGGMIIKRLKRKQVGETVRNLGLEGQMEKEGTPTMGGIIIILAILVPVFLVANLHNVYIRLMIFATLWMGMIGFVDDYIKIFRKNKKGLSGKFKVIGQVVLGLVISLTMLLNDDVVVRMELEDAKVLNFKVVKSFSKKTETGEAIEWAYVKAPLTNIPFWKAKRLDYSKVTAFLGDNAGKFVWIFFIPLVVFIVTAVSNAANLTDGIDGLATGVSGIIGVTLGVLAYVSSNAVFSDYLNIMYLPGTSELAIFSAGMFGATIGFLWYNAYPAQVFMGDTGSLTLGGIIASLAILIRTELMIPILCGVFLVETLSVVMQVGYFKYTKKKYGEGKRIFLMSPLHHHFQKKGIPEPKIVARFWIVGILLAVFTIVALKVR